MEETPMTGQEAVLTKKMRYGPGPLMVFGLALLVVAAWCGYDLWSQEEWYKKDELSKILFNWGGMIVAAAAAVYAFILAAVRSKKPA